MGAGRKAGLVFFLIFLIAVGGGIGFVVFKYKDNGGFDQALSDGINAVRRLIGQNTDGHVHEYTDYESVSEPTCDKQGKSKRTCVLCDYVDYKFTAPLGHAYESTVIEPTCLTGGYTENVCSRCGNTVRPESLFTEPLGHDIDENATCIDRTCGRDGCDYVEHKTTDHSFGDWKSGDPAPTCTTGGKQIRICTLCKVEQQERDADALGHDPDPALTTTTATCTTAGENTLHCRRCSIVYKEDQAALGHDLPDEYDCHDRECARCHIVITATGAHDMGEEVIPPACLTNGYTLHTCRKCGYNYQDTIVPTPYGSHDYGAWSNITGGRQRTCSRCGDVETQNYATVTATSTDDLGTIYGDGRFYPGDQVILTISIPQGYKFNGWYEGTDLLSGDTTCSFTMDEYNHRIKAELSLQNYNITYHDNGGSTSGIKPATFNFKNGAELPEMTKEDFTFVGWYLDDTFETAAGDLKGIKRNVDVYAYFTTQHKITLNDVDGISFDPVFAYGGDDIILPDVTRGGYAVTWYTDSGLVNPFTLTVMPDNDFELWGKQSPYIIGSFMDYYAEFTSSSISIDSDAEFAAYIEFIRFYRLTNDDLTEAQKHLTYSYLSTKAQRDAAFERVGDMSTYAGVYNLSYLEDTYEKIIITEDTIATNATLSAASEPTYPSYGYIGYEGEAQTSRAADFDDFPVNDRTRTLEVNASDDLVYALEHGFKPIPVASSRAEDMYAKAKVVLRKIVSDDMTNLEKVQAIYEWLVMETSYDYAALELPPETDWRKYDAYYLEGVFNNRRAVCDGISKAFVVMCNMEGIPAVRVTGDTTRQSSASGHAWNKVYLGGKWYVVDATWGSSLLALRLDEDTVVSNETMSFDHFLITDSQKTAMDCTADNYSELTANTSYNYYTSKTYTYSEDGGEHFRSFDLSIDTAEEFSNLTYYYNAYVNSAAAGDYTDFLISIRNNSGLEILDLVNAANTALWSRGAGIRISSFVPITKEGSTTDMSISLTIQ